ncbi:MAG TPA: hypothetical protein VEY30_08095, partial [Myxococcaceae bacterium]|nr:hypothetical protein [Myxococcaceae bacterium]
MGASVRVGIVASFLLLGGCAKRGPTSLLDEAARKAQGGKADARTLALAGFHALLADDNPVQAESRFDSAVTQNPGEPYALLGQMITGERQAAQDKTLTAAIELVTRTPTHPLAAIAARHLLDTSGTSAPQDDRIRTAAELSLARGAAGDAAQLLRSALAAIAYQRGDTATHARILAAMGVVDRVTLTGPHSVWHRLAFDETTPTEESGNVEANAPGPLGELRPRTLLFPDGRLGLSGEPPPGDVYLLSTDVEVARGGDYIVRTLSSASHKVLLDGTRLFERRTFERPESTVSQRGVTLRPGRHRVLIKLLKESRPPSISLSISRADGRPANLQLSPSTGSASTWSGVATREAPATFSRAQDVAAALEAEAGEALASYVAAWDGMNRDRDGAKRLVARLFNGGVQGPAATFLRAKVALGDRTVPSKVAQGRATRDVEATLEKDKEHVEALML